MHSSPSAIYWFSGTGNSLAIARAIADRLGNTKLVPIVQTINEDRFHAAGAVGIVCPVYFYGLPLIVREFIEQLDPDDIDYAYVVLTMGGFPGTALSQARSLLRAAGTRLDAEFALMMPGNYIIEYNAKTPQSARRMADRGRRKAKQFAEIVAARKRRRSIGSALALPISAVLHRLLGRRFEATCRNRDARFVVTDACTSCGTCARVCPVENVGLEDGRPVWSHACEQCFACIHFCPVEAIQVRGTRTDRRRRYHHPEITVGDLIVAAGVDRA